TRRAPRPIFGPGGASSRPPSLPPAGCFRPRRRFPPPGRVDPKSIPGGTLRPPRDRGLGPQSLFREFASPGSLPRPPSHQAPPPPFVGGSQQSVEKGLRSIVHRIGKDPRPVSDLPSALRGSSQQVIGRSNHRPGMIPEGRMARLGGLGPSFPLQSLPHLRGKR